MLGKQRDLFFVNINGFDTHGNANDKLQELMGYINAAVASFADEMKTNRIWDNIMIVSASDFARTLTSNGAGTNHAWGGNYFSMGGGLRGGRIFGSYPDDLSKD